MAISPRASLMLAIVDRTTVRDQWLYRHRSTPLGGKHGFRRRVRFAVGHAPGLSLLLTLWHPSRSVPLPPRAARALPVEKPRASSLVERQPPGPVKRA